MKYRVINRSGHAFPMGAIVSYVNSKKWGVNIYMDNKGCMQYLKPNQIKMVIDHLNINIRVL